MPQQMPTSFDSSDDDEEMQMNSSSRRSRMGVPSRRPVRSEGGICSKSQLWVMLSLAVFAVLVVSGVAVFREIQWSGKMKHSAHVASVAVADASQTIQRKHHGADTMPGDLKVLKKLVKAEQGLDDTATEATDRMASARTNVGKEKSEVQEKKMEGTNLLSVEPAISAVVKAVEKDVAASHGHPLMTNHGVPMSSQNKEIYKLGKNLESAEKLADDDIKANERDVEKLTTLPKDKMANTEEEASEIKERIALRKKNVKDVQEFETKVVAKIESVAKAGKV
jgi:hypothetical protein